MSRCFGLMPKFCGWASVISRVGDFRFRRNAGSRSMNHLHNTSTFLMYWVIVGGSAAQFETI
jgi:hypothetical protein